MWLGSGVAVAVASGYSSDLTPSLELPYAAGVALKNQKQTNKQTKKECLGDKEPR